MKTDGRSLNHEALEHIRKVAVGRVKAGERPGAVIQSYGFSRTAISKWLKAEAKGGEEALRSRKATGRPRKLTARQMDQVRRWINGKDPRQHGFDFGLWTRSIVAALIEERLGGRRSSFWTSPAYARTRRRPGRGRRGNRRRCCPPAASDNPSTPSRR